MRRPVSCFVQLRLCMHAGLLRAGMGILSVYHSAFPRLRVTLGMDIRACHRGRPVDSRHGRSGSRTLRGDQRRDPEDTKDKDKIKKTVRGLPAMSLSRQTRSPAFWSYGLGQFSARSATDPALAMSSFVHDHRVHAYMALICDPAPLDDWISVPGPPYLCRRQAREPEASVCDK